MKKLFYKCFIFIFIISSTLNAQNTEELIEKKVESQLLKTLSKIPVGSEKRYGFTSREDFQRCTLGKSIKVLTINTINMKDSLVEINEWRIPIKLDGQNILLITAKKIKNVYEIVDLGGELLAKELQETKINENENQYLLRLFNLHIDFITSSNGAIDLNETVFKPMNSAKTFLDLTHSKNIKTHYTLKEIIELNKI